MTRHAHHPVMDDSTGDPADQSVCEPASSPLTAVQGEDRGEYPAKVERPSGKALGAAIDNDPLVQAIRSGAGLVERLQAAKLIIAEQVALLRWLELHPDSVDDLVETGRAISRRVRATKRLVEIELQQARHASTEQVDMGSPKVREVFNLLMDTIADVTNEMLPEGTAAEVTARFRAKVEANNDIPWP